ncbi:hypothetical protein [Arsukibacterium sp.]|uniref:hypothetical protein n=1 Tax=Arsukibacterium sp. TaxID=1977258 RepID=UPI002FD991BF
MDHSKKNKTTAWSIRLLGYFLSVFFFSLALLHFSPGSRFAVQSWLIGLDNDFQQSLFSIAGGKYFIHNYEDSLSLHVSMVHKLPTRYLRDMIFWSRLKPGMSFAVEPLQQNEYGVEFIFIENNPEFYELTISLPNREKICLKEFAVWRIVFEDTPATPNYVAVNFEYQVSFNTDDTKRWQLLEKACS